MPDQEWDGWRQRDELGNWNWEYIRFMIKIEESDDEHLGASGESSKCWLWMGALSKECPRYVENREGGDRRTVAASRWLYQKRFGLLASTDRLRNLCGRSWCVNYDHWQPQSQRDRSYGRRFRPSDML